MNYKQANAPSPFAEPFDSTRSIILLVGLNNSIPRPPRKDVEPGSTASPNAALERTKIE